ncbi:AI-2E family transporter [Patescibacteria group bacterium]|nr:AI-2E family transporter [Patescibacteria group bacterium]
MTSKIEISHRTIIFTVLLLAGIWLVLQIKDILFLLFISFVLMSALRPLVDRIEGWRIPRPLAILLIYAVVLGGISYSFASVVPVLIGQFSRFLQSLPYYVSRLSPNWSIDIQSLTQQITPIGENLVRLTVGIFSNILALLTILMFTFYFLLERKKTDGFLVSIVGGESTAKFSQVLREVEERLGAWVGGEVFLMTVIGVLSFVGLTLLHVDFALPLAILAGLLEAVPMIGPVLSAVPAILVALATSPLLALSVVALYFIIQQAENNLIVPIVMKRSVGLSPLWTIMALLVGGRLGGVAGAILAIPLVLVFQIVLKQLLLQQKNPR